MDYKNYEKNNYIEVFDPISGKYVLMTAEEGVKLCKCMQKGKPLINCIKSIYYDNLNVDESYEHCSQSAGSTIAGDKDVESFSFEDGKDVYISTIAGDKDVYVSTIAGDKDVESFSFEDGKDINMSFANNEYTDTVASLSPHENNLSQVSRLPYHFPFPIPIPIPVPSRPVNNNRAIRLAIEIFYDIKMLEFQYEELVKRAGQNGKQTLKGMLVKMYQIEQSVRSVYSALSGGNLPCDIKKTYAHLPRNYCARLHNTGDIVAKSYDKVVALKQMVRINEIDRELMLVLSILQKHMNLFNRLMIDCIL